MSRYAEPRQVLQWNTGPLRIAKELAYCLFHHESSCHSVHRLWDRVVELFPEVSWAVLGQRLEFSKVVEDVYSKYKIVITRTKLYQRADKAKRYKEFNIYHASVEAAYLASVKGPTGTKDQKRTFPDSICDVVYKEQDGSCYYCGCPLETNGYHADHIIPHSRGGPTKSFNCALACIRCNEEKGSMSVYEYGKLVGEKVARSRKKHPMKAWHL